MYVLTYTFTESGSDNCVGIEDDSGADDTGTDDSGVDDAGIDDSGAGDSRDTFSDVLSACCDSSGNCSTSITSVADGLPVARGFSIRLNISLLLRIISKANDILLPVPWFLVLIRRGISDNKKIIIRMVKKTSKIYKMIIKFKKFSQ